MPIVQPVDSALVADAKAVGLIALQAIKTAIDTTLGGVEKEVPQLMDDAAAVAEGFLAGHAGNRAAGFLSGIFGLAGGLIAQGTQLIDKALVAELILLNTSIDDHIDAFGAKNLGGSATKGTAAK